MCKSLSKSGESRHDISAIRILLVGREGNGKRSCVKTIAEQKSIANRDDNGQTSVIESVSHVTNATKTLIALDCPGVGDSGEDRKEGIATVINNVQKQVSECDKDGGLSAIVLVLKYGVRFTKQEKDAVQIVKSVFGDDVFCKYGVILMTYGDLFEQDKEDDGSTYIDWCRNQTGDIKPLFDEVSYRTVLFDNKTKDSSKREEQYKTLYDIVSGMNIRYRAEQFKNAKAGRDLLIRNETKVKKHTSVDIPDLANDQQYDHRENQTLFNFDPRLGMLWLFFFMALGIVLVLFIAELHLGLSMVAFICFLLWIAIGVVLNRLGLIDLHLCYPFVRLCLRFSYTRL